MAPRLQVVRANPTMQRKMRYPQHHFSVESRPWQIVPTMIAPVLPGETMTNLNLQARTVTDPLAAGFAALMPWWAENYWYYVKLRDLDIRDDVENALLKGAPLPVRSGQRAGFYHTAGQVDWLGLCYERVVAEYFRDEGEAWNSVMIGDYAAASAVPRRQNWLDSLAPVSALEGAENHLQDPHSHDVLEEYRAMYDKMVQMQMIEMSFEEWLRPYGVTGQQTVEAYKPEEIRYAREWTYPTNTVDPVTGVPNSAVSWSVSERADKDRFFTEPGFIIGLSVFRPKVYLGNQRSAAVAGLDNALGWLPALMRDEPHTSLRPFPISAANAGASPVTGQTEEHWVDMRDLFLYGDQFVNHAAAANKIAAPSAASELRYATAAMADALFKQASANKIRTDGVHRLAVKGHQTTSTDNT